MKSLRIGLFVLLLSVTASGTAQDYSQMSDDALALELDRLSTHRYSNSQRRGYRDRVTASDYELEFQMQQIDKRAAEDNYAQQRMLRGILQNRQAVRDADKQAQRIADYEASGQEARQHFRGWLETQQQQLALAQERLSQQQRARMLETQARIEQSRAQQTRQTEAFFERSRTRPVQPPRVQPIAPGPTGPSFSIPSGFPEHRPAYVRQRTPLEAFREGQELGEAIGGMIRGFMDRDKKKRKDAIVKRYFSDTITREDYEQLVDDGYADLALELKQAERR